MSSSGARRTNGKKKAGALPVIDLGRLLGPNFRRQSGTAAAAAAAQKDNGENATLQSQKSGDTGSVSRKEQGVIVQSRRETNDQVNDDGAFVPFKPLSMLQPQGNSHPALAIMSNDMAASMGEAKVHLSVCQPRQNSHPALSMTQSLQENVKEKPLAPPVILHIDVSQRQHGYQTLPFAVLPSSEPFWNAHVNNLSHQTLPWNSNVEGDDLRHVSNVGMNPNVGGLMDQLVRKRHASVYPGDFRQDENRATKFASVNGVSFRLPLNAPETAVPTSLNRCMIVQHPVLDSSMDDGAAISLPSFHQLINFPGYAGTTVDKNIKKRCVMCGELLPFCRSRKEKDEAHHFISKSSKGVCSRCNVAVWEVVGDDKQHHHIKFCNACRNFHPWGAFWNAKKTGLRKRCSHCTSLQTISRKRSRLQAQGNPV